MSFLDISEEIRQLGAQAEKAVRPYFDVIDEISEYNTEKVLAAFAKNRVAEAMFAGTTGYGYDDKGRDTLDQIYADIFGTEAALVRIGFVNGTHALCCAMYSAVKTGDVVLSATGPAYDTLMNTITGDNEKRSARCAGDCRSGKGRGCQAGIHSAKQGIWRAGIAVL